MSTPETPQLDDLGLARRVLGFIHQFGSKVQGALVPRNTVDGLSKHLTDDPYTAGDTSVPAVEAHLNDLVGAGLAEHNGDGTYSVTGAGAKALGGIVYADAVAAGLLETLPDGTHKRTPVGDAAIPHVGHPSEHVPPIVDAPAEAPVSTEPTS